MYKKNPDPTQKSSDYALDGDYQNFMQIYDNFRGDPSKM